MAFATSQSTMTSPLPGEPSWCAPGKAILFGEHAVVYGQPALAMALDLEFCVKTYQWNTTNDLAFSIPSMGLTASLDSPAPFGDVLKTIDQLLPGEGLTLEIGGNLPLGAGLGGSAAISVTLVRAIGTLRGLELDCETIRLYAHTLEKIFHGSPSGLDDSLASYGGMGVFCHQPDILQSLQTSSDRFDVLSEKLLRLDTQGPPLLIGDTNVPRQTKIMVEGVRERWRRDKKRSEALFETIGNLTREGIHSLEQADWPKLGELMNLNQDALRHLEVSCHEIERMVDLALKHGAYGAKLTGAGGGGCVLALADTKEALTDIANVWKQNGFTVYEAGQDSGKGSIL